jgi:hypothetical protein
VLARCWPPTRVHCWGGLGSQLYALNFIFDVKSKFPKKKFILIQHTSGFTHRSAELDFLDLDFINVKEIEDFDLEFRSSQSSSDKSIKFRTYIKYLLNLTGFYLFEEHLSKKTKIYNWTLAVRGSYSNIDLDKKLLEFLVSMFKSSSNKTTVSPNTLAIHYRLGDLLNLSSKSHLYPTQFSFALDKDINNKVWTIFSDSPEIAIAELHKTFPHLKREINNWMYLQV